MAFYFADFLQLNQLHHNASEGTISPDAGLDGLCSPCQLQDAELMHSGPGDTNGCLLTRHRRWQLFFSSPD